MQWFEALHVFVLVAENKSFVGAAKKLHMPTSKVTKLIQWLEARLKTILLIRTTRQITLTENGEYFLSRAKNLVGEWLDLQASMHDREQKPSGNLHLASPPSILSTQPFMQIISCFLKRYPDINISTSTFTKPFSFSYADADFFIGKDHYLLDHSDVISRPCLTFQYGIYASPTYLETHTIPNTPAELSAHNCLGNDNVWEFSNGPQFVNGNFSSDASTVIQSAVCHNLGIARIATFLTQQLVNEGKLVPVLDKWYTKPEQLKIYYRKLSYQPRKLKLFIDFLLGQLATFSL